jgi:trehalose 6-phosphate synthase/phosphatase
MSDVNPPHATAELEANGRSGVLIVSNRLPVAARRRADRVRIVKSEGGLATGLDQVRRVEPSLWIGWPGRAARDTSSDWPEFERRFRKDGLVPVRLSDDDLSGYYDGFSNGVIWPLFHHLLDRIPIDSGNWDAYRRVNERFAAAVERAWRPGDRIWIHDYHLMLLPELVRRALPRARIGFFLHIPFPGIDVFRVLPWRRALIEGILGADVIGFHTIRYVQHFLDAVRQLADVEPMTNHVWWRGRAVHVDAVPMGIDALRFGAIGDRPAIRERAEAIRADAKGRQILLAVDRLDYTKGIPRRLLAFQRLLERDPSLIDRVRFIQVAAPSRIDVKADRAFRHELDELTGRINGMFGGVDSLPVHYLSRSVATDELVALYRAADVMVVTPLRDGMNLVAKEFVATRTDDDGVLILSEFAGAARQLTEALIVNPYDVDGVAGAMGHALSMSPDERRHRMRRLRARVNRSSVYEWAGGFLKRLGHEQIAAAVGSVRRPDDALVALGTGSLTLANPVTLLVDYDGTLVGFANVPNSASPDPDLIAMLTALAAHPAIDFHIVTGRSLATVQQWFWHVPAGLWAEHGAACRLDGSTWERIVTIERRWIDRARAFLEDVCADTPGSLIEQKTCGLAWHYRMVETSLAAERLRHVKETLSRIVRDAPLELLEGRMVLELRPRGVSKALVVRCLASRRAPTGSTVVIGDDNTDEEMFGAMPPGGIAIHVGNTDSCAAYRLENPTAVRQFLGHVLASRPACGSVHFHKRPVAAGPGS